MKFSGTVFCMFDELWERENPASVMEFSMVRAKLYEDLVNFLTQSDYATLKPLEATVE